MKNAYEKSYIKPRFKIFERDNFKCVYCGKSSIEDGIELIIEHIYPLIKGGKNDLNNIVTACKTCNQSKSSNILGSDIIFRLWNRNNQLNMIFNKQEYQELKKIFDKMYNQRQVAIETA